ncbi:hypothetical protein E3A20_29750, partial [Planctomyces bekefii]
SVAKNLRFLKPLSLQQTANLPQFVLREAGLARNFGYVQFQHFSPLPGAGDVCSR